MSKLPVISTKTGDDGTSALWSGERIPKYDIRFELIGHLDTFDSFLGIIRNKLSKSIEIDTSEIYDSILKIQERLIYLKGEIATEWNKQDKFCKEKPAISDVDVDYIEKCSETLKKYLESKNHKITGWSIPGDKSELNTFCHLARAKCRECEIKLYQTKISQYIKNHTGYSVVGNVYNYREPIYKYINRLSDYLYWLTEYLD